MRSGNLGWSERTYSQRPLGLLSIPESGPSSDGDDLRARIRQFLLVPVAELFLDSEARTGKEGGQCVYAKEPQGTSTGLKPVPASTCERYGERDSVPGNGCLDMVRHSYPAPVVQNPHCIVRSPPLPLPSQRIAGLEHEAPIPSESGPYRGQRLSQLVVFKEHLECKAGHHGDFELPTPID